MGISQSLSLSMNVWCCVLTWNGKARRFVVVGSAELVGGLSTNGCWRAGGGGGGDTGCFYNGLGTTMSLLRPPSPPASLCLALSGTRIIS